MTDLNGVSDVNAEALITDEPRTAHGASPTKGTAVDYRIRTTPRPPIVPVAKSTPVKSIRPKIDRLPPGFFFRPVQHREAFVGRLRLATDCTIAADGDPSAWTIAQDLGQPQTKSFENDPDTGLWTQTGDSGESGRWFFYQVHVPDLAAALSLVSWLGGQADCCLLRAGVDHGRYGHDYDLARRRQHSSWRTDNEVGGPLLDVERTNFMLDKDNNDLPPGHSYDNPAALAAYMIENLPEPFRGASYVWQFSGSAGLHRAVGEALKVKLHVFGQFTEPVGCDEFHHMLGDRDAFGMLDQAAAVGIQKLFTARPILVGGEDPVAQRVGLYEGTGAVDVTVIREGMIRQAARAAEQRARSAKKWADTVASGRIDRKAYMRVWQNILAHRIGYGEGRAGNYHAQIARMVWEAIEAGETNFEFMKATLCAAVTKIMYARGDDHKASDVARYLSDTNLYSLIEKKLGSYGAADEEIVPAPKGRVS